MEVKYNFYVCAKQSFFFQESEQPGIDILKTETEEMLAVVDDYSAKRVLNVQVICNATIHICNFSVVS